MIVLSIVDRLMTSRQRSEPPTLAMLMETVRRDLDTLLNTRRPECAELERHPYLATSVRHFGLRDFTAYDLRQPGIAARVASSIAEAIRLHEPRLRNVSVTVDEASDPPAEAVGVRTLAFRIRAELAVESVRERIRVTAVVDGRSGRLLADRMVPDA